MKEYIEECEDDWDDDDDYPDHYYEDEQVDFDPFDENYYSAWDEVVNPPHWYTCRECNGVGHDPYGTPCEKCNHTGVKYPLVHSIICFVERLKNFGYSRLIPFRRCGYCGRWYWAFMKHPQCPYNNCLGSIPF